jgi:hypothetical protein
MLKKNPTIKDFQIIQYVNNEQIEMVLGKRKAKKFWKWMAGQTVPIGGVYPWDLERWLDLEFRGKPTYFD